MSHEHVPGWRTCPGAPPETGSCGLPACADCPTCWKTHLRLHHPKRKRRIKRQEVTA